MRAFLAVVPPRAARDAVEAVREPLREFAPNGRWVHPSLWHLTLKFLGEVEDDLIPAVIDLVGDVASGHLAFELVLAGTGLFPNAERPRVLWTGLREGADPLRALARALDESLDGLGFTPEPRAFQPHLTVARFREPRDAGSLSQHVGPTEEIARFNVDCVVLMRSVLRPRGPDYSVVEKLSLAPRDEPAAGDEPAAEGPQPEPETEAESAEDDE